MVSSCVDEEKKAHARREVPDGLRQAGRIKPGLILLDIGLPDTIDCKSAVGLGTIFRIELPTTGHPEVKEEQLKSGG